MKVTATATRAGDWWAIEIADAPGGPFHTQTRRLDQVEAMVKDGIALMAGIPEEAIQVTVIPNLAQRDAELIDAARAASQEAVRAAERASQLSRQAVARLRAEGMTVRDVGGLLGVTPQRVSQLAGTVPAACRAPALPR